MKKRMKWLLLAGGLCITVLAGTAVAANQEISIFVDGRSLNLGQHEVQLADGKIVAPVRAVAEGMGGRVVWDQEKRAVHVQSGVSKAEVAGWIREQGKEQDPSAYYFDGLFVEEVNLDSDPELEVLARIDGGVHLGNFFVFDRRPDGTYALIYEQAWRVEAWEQESYAAIGETPLFKIVTRTGGTGIDTREAHLMYMDENGAWTEAWTGTLKDRAAYQNIYHIVLGSYQINDDNGELVYWQTEREFTLEDLQPIGEATTRMQLFELKDGRYVEAEAE